MYQYYNQNNYPETPYPAKGYENATLKTSGCGVCCASMVLANLDIVNISPPQMAAFAIRRGARVPGGTDVEVLLKALAEQYPLEWYTTTNADKAFSEFRYNKCMLICNAAGDHGNYKGLFSDGGHYVVMANMSNLYAYVLDPGMYPGKYDKPGRKSRVKVVGDIVYTDPENVKTDCWRFFVCKKKKGVEPLTVDEGKKILKEKVGLADKTIEFLYNYRWGDDLIVKLANAISK